MATEYIQKIGHIIIPAVIFVSAMLFNLNVIPMTPSFKVMVPFVLMVGFYWSIYRPQVAPIWSIFLCGLMIDIVSGLPLGLNALSLTLICLIVRDQRVVLITQPFFMLWGVFALFCIAEALVKWAVFSLTIFQIASLSAVLPDIIFGVLLYPFIALFLHAIGKLFLDGDIYKGGMNG